MREHTLPEMGNLHLHPRDLRRRQLASPPCGKSLIGASTVADWSSRRSPRRSSQSHSTSRSQRSRCSFAADALATVKRTVAPMSCVSRSRSTRRSSRALAVAYTEVRRGRCRSSSCPRWRRSDSSASIRSSAARRSTSLKQTQTSSARTSRSRQHSSRRSTREIGTRPVTRPRSRSTRATSRARMGLPTRRSREGAPLRPRPRHRQDRAARRTAREAGRADARGASRDAASTPRSASASSRKVDELRRDRHDRPPPPRASRRGGLPGRTQRTKRSRCCHGSSRSQMHITR